MSRNNFQLRRLLARLPASSHRAIRRLSNVPFLPSASVATFLGAMAVAMATPAQASPIIDFTSSGNPVFVVGQPFTFGYSFIVSENVAVDRLGVYSITADQVETSHDVGLWMEGVETELASTTVGLGATLKDNSASSDGAYFYADTPISIILESGVTYFLGALYGASTPGTVRVGVGGIFSPDPQDRVTYLNGQFHLGGVLSFPDVSSASNEFFGPTLRLASSIPPEIIPAPPTLALLILGVVGLRIGQRRVF